MPDIGKMIRELRDGLPTPLTADELAQRIGVTGNIIRNIETGRTKLTRGIAVAIARELGVPVEQLLTGNAQGQKLVRLPYWGLVPAGNWERPNDNVQFENVPEQWGYDDGFTLRIWGESMLPTLSNGDLIICREVKRPPIGSIVIARNHDQELTVKRLVYVERKPILRPDNPNYPDLNPEDCEIVGQALHAIKNL